MLITRNILNKALEDKVPLFHDGDYIDDDVLYDLFYAPAKSKILPNGRKGKTTFISKDDRNILCAEMKGYNPQKRKEGFDKIYCRLKCKSCGKIFPIHITKWQIISRGFKIKECIKPIYGSPTDKRAHTYHSHYISFHELYGIKFGKADNIYVCDSCIDKFISDSNKEAFEILERNDKFEWFRSDESVNDWRRGLFYVEPNCIGTKINARNGDSWTDEKYNEWQKRQEQKKEEELNHQRELEEIHHQQKLDEEAERERTRKANELFLASHQKNTPTQRYINKFCKKNSYVDITDKEIQREALFPKDVNYEEIQKENCKSYGEYLQSPLWRIISSKIKWNANYRCERCGSNKNLVTHHASYEFKDVEFLAFHTLQCLCSKCHEKEHDKQIDSVKYALNI